MSNHNNKVAGQALYLCYFGLNESLVQTQVLPYLRQVRESGVKIFLLTFEPNPKENWTSEQIEREREALAAEGIEWHFLTYHKRPTVPATFYDVLCGVYFTLKLMRREKIDVLHGRSYVATFMGAIAKKLSRRKPKILFDIRGFFPEEYVDAGNWKENGWLFKLVKRAEKWLLKESDGFVVLTEKAQEILFPDSWETGFDKLGRPVEVIPCCVDLERFKFADSIVRQQTISELNLENRSVIVYVGSFGGWYMTQEMIDFFGVAKKKDSSTFALILTQSNSKEIKELLKQAGLAEEDFFVQKVHPKEVPKFLCAADSALSFIKPCYSKLSSSPTKLAEYLACGVPVITNRGIGDVDSIIESDGVGTILDTFNAESYAQCLDEINDLPENVSEKCKLSSQNRFDLISIGGVRYKNIYKSLLNAKDRSD